MATLANEAVIHVQEHLGICHYKSMFTLIAFLEDTFENEGNEEIKNCPRCKNFYGIALQYGSGVHKDSLKGLKLIESAASQGYLKAMYNLVQTYEKGDGVEVDIEKAYELCKNAAERGYTDAVRHLPVITKKYRSSLEFEKVNKMLNKE